MRTMLAIVILLAACDDDDDSTGIGGTTTIGVVNATNTPLDFATAGTIATGNANVGFGGSSACTVLNAVEPDFELRQAGTFNSLSTSTYMPAFTAGNTYLVVAYRPIAASAMASNSAMRSSFAAAFPLFASQMYAALGTVGATALLAGLATAMAPLP